MTGAIQRLLIALSFTIFFHTAILSYQLEQVLTRPAPLPVQRISVSLGVTKTTKQQPVIKAAVLLKDNSIPIVQEKTGKTRAPEPAPKPQKIIATRIKRKITSPPVTTEEMIVEPLPEPDEAKIDNQSQDVKPAAAEVIQLATPLYRINPPPKYPNIARRRNQEGVVVLQALIDIAGKVSQLKLFNSSGYPILDKAALKTVHRWRFTPGTIGDKRQPMWVKVPVRFQLR